MLLPNQRRRERGEAIAIVGTAVRHPRGRRRSRAMTGRAAGEQLRESVVQPAQRSRRHTGRRPASAPTTICRCTAFAAW